MEGFVDDDDIYKPESEEPEDGAVDVPPEGDIDSTVRSTDPLALINEFLSIAKASIRIKKLTVIQREGGNPFSIRPQLHILISAPFGNVKSTMLDAIQQSGDAYSVDSATFPSLVGTIDWNARQFIPAATWKARNKILLLDEFNPYRDPKVKEALLQLLERQTYARELGLAVEFNVNEEDGDLYFKVIRNRLEIKTRFSCVLATMHNIRNIGDMDSLALISRFLPFSYRLSIEEMNGILSGRDIVTIRPIEVGENVQIELSDYRRIRRMVKQTLQSSGLSPDIQTQWYMRAVNDAVRVYAVTKNFDLIPIVAKLKASIGDTSVL